MTDRPEHKNRPTADGAPPGNDAFEEALDAAKVFDELARDEPAVPGADAVTPARHAAGGGDARPAWAADELAASEAAFADDFDLRGSVARAEAALDAAEVTLRDRRPRQEAKPAHPAAESPAPTAPPAGPSERQSIGLLFKTVVRHSPPSKIRIESGSIGALFRRFIEQE